MKQREVFLSLLDWACRSFGVVLEIKSISRFDTRYDEGQPRVRSDGLFRWQEIRPDQWAEAFTERSEP
jgi:hypothetical protein